MTRFYRHLLQMIPQAQASAEICWTAWADCEACGWLCRRDSSADALQGARCVHSGTPPPSWPLLWQGSSPFEYRGLETESDDDETPRGLPAAVAAAHATMSTDAQQSGAHAKRACAAEPRQCASAAEARCGKGCTLSGAHLPPVSNSLVLSQTWVYTLHPSSVDPWCFRWNTSQGSKGCATGMQAQKGHIHCARYLPYSAPTRTQSGRGHWWQCCTESCDEDM